LVIELLCEESLREKKLNRNRTIAGMRATKIARKGSLIEALRKATQPARNPNRNQFSTANDFKMLSIG
jgi:hypothetical protein